MLFWKFFEAAQCQLISFTVEFFWHNWLKTIGRKPDNMWSGERLPVFQFSMTRKISTRILTRYSTQILLAPSLTTSSRIECGPRCCGHLTSCLMSWQCVGLEIYFLIVSSLLLENWISSNNYSQILEHRLLTDHRLIIGYYATDTTFLCRVYTCNELFSLIVNRSCRA